MHFELIDESITRVQSEDDLELAEVTDEPMVLRTENGWKVFLNRIVSSVGADEVVNEAEEAIKKVKSGSTLEMKRTRKSFSHFTSDIMQLPFLYDRTNEVRYLSVGITNASFNGAKNSSFHRVEIIDGDAFIFVGNGDLRRMLDSSEKGLSVCISNPSTPEVAIASSLSIGYGNDEMEVASEMCRMEGKEMTLIDREESVPWDSNFLIEGIIGKSVVDIAETFFFPTGPVKKNIPYRKLEIDNIFYDKKLAYGIIQGGMEHNMLYEIAKGVNPEIKTNF